MVTRHATRWSNFAVLSPFSNRECVKKYCLTNLRNIAKVQSKLLILLGKFS